MGKKLTSAYALPTSALSLEEDIAQRGRRLPWSEDSQISCYGRSRPL